MNTEDILRLTGAAIKAGNIGLLVRVIRDESLDPTDDSYEVWQGETGIITDWEEGRPDVLLRMISDGRWGGASLDNIEPVE